MNSSQSHFYDNTELQNREEGGCFGKLSFSAIADFGFRGLASLDHLMPLTGPNASMVGPHKRVDHDADLLTWLCSLRAGKREPK